MIEITTSGNFKNTENFLKKAKGFQVDAILNKYGKAGVQALVQATPTLTGKTASSWDYIIEKGSGSYTIYWTNSNVNQGVNIAVILQYGHGTRNGGYVQGIDYINSPMRKVFEDLANEAWKELTSK